MYEAYKRISSENCLAAGSARRLFSPLQWNFSLKVKDWAQYCDCHRFTFCLSLCDIVHPSSCLWQRPPWKGDFWAAQAIWSNFHFQNFFFFTQNFFHPKFFFTSKKIFPLSIFYAFLDILCCPECSKKFSPKFFLGEARRDTMLPSTSSFTSWSMHFVRDMHLLQKVIQGRKGSSVTAFLSLRRQHMAPAFYL